jgi:aldehyde dehydrogenase (NAD(P)+)
MDLFVDIVTPNGKSYKQPTGLFINNEIVPATGGQTITSIDPAYVITNSCHDFMRLTS